MAREFPEGMVTVYWYEHSCEWLTKYCDEHHRRSAQVPANILPTRPLTATDLGAK